MLARRFAREKIAPAAPALDESGEVRCTTVRLPVPTPLHIVIVDYTAHDQGVIPLGLCGSYFSLVRSQYPWELIREAHGLGLMNLHIPSDFGAYDEKMVIV